MADPVILVDAPDPDDLEDVVVQSREKRAIAGDSSVDRDRAEARLTTTADRLVVLVLFGDEVYGYTMGRPPG